MDTNKVYIFTEILSSNIFLSKLNIINTKKPDAELITIVFSGFPVSIAKMKKRQAYIVVNAKKTIFTTDIKKPHNL